MGVMLIIMILPLLISIPLIMGLKKCIGWVNLLFIVLFLTSMLATGPLGWYGAITIAACSRNRNDTDSSTSRELKLMLSKIVIFLAIVLNVILIYYLFLGNPFKSKDYSPRPGGITFERTIYIPVK